VNGWSAFALLPAGSGVADDAAGWSANTSSWAGALKQNSMSRPVARGITVWFHAIPLPSPLY
ncbi:MAG TPA: hypothetical protein VG672_08455, partial [Bryobacteraceae bacterium]|nr:hypothetical protein [Bryobacteraceae bacterium]